MSVIICCGHGGLVNGQYQDLNAEKTPPDYKSYVFPDGFTVYEGVVNRQIAGRLTRLLKVANVGYHDLNILSNFDMPLHQRVKKINDIYQKDKNAWLLSIHSNKMTRDGEGASLPGRGCETYIAINAGKKSQAIQVIAEKHYKNDGHRYRGSNTANFYILKNTNCPAILVENYFYTNRQDAEFLMSPPGQEKIASTLFKIIKETGMIFAD